MKTSRSIASRCLTVGVVLALVAVPRAADRRRLTTRATPSPASAQGLKVVVIAGEDAVNVIQQKTAVSPVVEVRDRNDQPVAGATVRFAIRAGRATFNGARTITVTTDAAGRASGAGLAPSGSGPLRISATASFQGQTAIATIVQTNVATAAQAASVAGASGAGGGTATAGAAAGATALGGAATGAATGGGLVGMSATTLGIVGGAAVGGTLVTMKATGGSDAARYQGAFSTQVVESITNVLNGKTVGACTWTKSLTGTMTADLGGQSASTFGGDADVDWTETEVSRTCSTGQAPYADSWRQGISGPAANLLFNRVFTGPSANGGTVTRTLAFVGSLSGDAITGVLTWSFSFAQILPNGEVVNSGYPPSSASVTLQRQAQ